MPKKPRKKVTVVDEHPRRVPVSKKNPTGITIVDEHLRRLPGTYLDPNEIANIFKNYLRDGLRYPKKNKIKDYKNADEYDELIAVWVDYFNKKFNMDPPLDPDVVKALIASESGFNEDPPNNPIAIGIAQITKETLKIVQDPKGEAKEFIFKDIRQKDLKNPEIAIPIAVRWLCRKTQTAKSKLGRNPTHEEIILEYKGLLKSNSSYKKNAISKYRKHHEELKN